MTSAPSGPSYYTPTYGLPAYDEPSAARFDEKEPWSAPGVGVGRLQWEPLHGRNTPYPWEQSRPPEAWERTNRTVDEGRLPARPAPMAPPPPSALPSQSEPGGEPSMTELVRKAWDRDGQTHWQQPAQAPPSRPARPPANVAPQPPVGRRRDQRRPRPPAPNAPDSGLSIFAPPQGEPIRPRPDAAVVNRGKKSGGVPYVALILILVVLVEPAGIMLPILGALVLFATAKNYRNPAARIGWGVFVLALAVVAIVVRALIR